MHQSAGVLCDSLDTSGRTLLLAIFFSASFDEILQVEKVDMEIPYESVLAIFSKNMPLKSNYFAFLRKSETNASPVEFIMCLLVKSNHHLLEKPEIVQSECQTLSITLPAGASPVSKLLDCRILQYTIFCLAKFRIGE